MKRISVLFVSLLILANLSGQPVNDSCHQALVLPVPDSCAFSYYSSLQATSETGVAPKPTCGFYQGGDVWFKATMPASGAFRVEVENIAGNNQLAIYEGSCGNMQQLTCLQLDGDRTISRPDLAGHDLLIRSYRYNSSNGGEFNLCVWEPDIPVNNDCGNAIHLEVRDSCHYERYTNAYATADSAGTAPGPGCGFYKGGDVWFTFVMPKSGHVRLEKQGISTNIQVAIYAGKCGNMAPVECLQLDNARTFIDPGLAGDTLYIRAYSYNSEEGGEFEICLWEPDVPVNNNCADAIHLPVGDSCQYQTFTNAFADGDSAGTAPGPGCGFYKGGDVWFTFAMPASGNLRLEKRGISTNIQVAIYAGICGNMVPVECLQLDNDRTFVDPGLAGDTLYIRAYSYNSEEGGEFEICLFEPEIPINDLCANAIDLINRDTCRMEVFTNEFATPDSAGTAPDPTCGFYKGGDVWFNVVMPPTGTLEVQRQNIAGVNAQMALYAGICGEFTLKVCAQNESVLTFTDSSLIGQELYLRVFNYNAEEGGAFSLCSVDTTCEMRERVDSVTICAGGSYSIAGETYDSSGTYEIRLRAKGGCDSVIITHVTELPPVETYQNVQLCRGDTLPVGDNFYQQTGLYLDTLTSDRGCDSVVVSQLTVDTVEVQVQSNDTSLFASPGYPIYNWIDCDSGFSPIAGATDSVFTPDNSGRYAVIATDSLDCSDTSGCIDFVAVGMPEIGFRMLMAYPNPAQNSIRLKHGYDGPVAAILYDQLGREIKQMDLPGKQAIINCGDWPAGWYSIVLIQLESGQMLDRTAILKME